MSQNNLSFSLRFLLGLAAFGLTLFFMNQASTFIVEILLAWTIVLSASPLFYWLRLKRVPGGLSFVITLLAIVAVFGFLVYVLIVAAEQLIELLGLPRATPKLSSRRSIPAASWISMQD